jgi:ankyrin repeat protein
MCHSFQKHESSADAPRSKPNYPHDQHGQSSTSSLQNLDLFEDQKWFNATEFLSDFAMAQTESSSWGVGEFDTNFTFDMQCPPGSSNAPVIRPQEVYLLQDDDIPESEFSAEFAASQQTPQAGLLNFNPNMATPIDIPDLTDAPSPFSVAALPSTPNLPAAVASANSSARQLDRLKPKLRTSKPFNPDRNSTSTYDSGYGSGRNSPFSLRVVDRQTRRVVPSRPFNGLHQIPCKTSHEPRSYNVYFSPQPTDRYLDIPTCQYCKYSAIHNLSWSAQHLKFEVFASELNLLGIYDVTALDAAGNSALHYAAIGGARLEYIAALIRAGINPCQINTSGELFLHCLRPTIEQANLRFEENVFPAFKTNLINLLNDLGQKYNGFFRWRDNGGRTALDTFVSSICDNDIKSRVIE